MATKLHRSGWFLSGLILGLSAGRLWTYVNALPTAKAQEATGGAAPDATSLAAELAAIKDKLPDQAHAMQDVGYHFSNLWFAGSKANWDLAVFYLNETKSHLHWAVRIIPVRKDNAGQTIDLAALLEAAENGPLKQVQDAIEAKDGAAFERAYRFTLETCYACHKASDKPYLRPQIPVQPETPIINFDPKATWPK
jgi:hypothetical protein